MALHGIPITVYVIVQIKYFQNREEETIRRWRLNNSIRTSVHVDMPQLNNWTYYFHHKTLHHFLSSSMWQAWDGNSRIWYHILDTQHKMCLSKDSLPVTWISWRNSHPPENSRNLLTTSRNLYQLERTKNIPVTKVQLFTMFPLCNHISMQKLQTEMFF